MEIEHPTEKTYYIIVDENDNHLDNGSIEPTQCLYSQHTIQSFTVYQDYVNALANFGITLNENII